MKCPHCDESIGFWKVRTLSPFYCKMCNAELKVNFFRHALIVAPPIVVVSLILPLLKIGRYERLLIGLALLLLFIRLGYEYFLEIILVKAPDGVTETTQQS